MPLLYPYSPCTPLLSPFVSHAVFLLITVHMFLFSFSSVTLSMPCDRALVSSVCRDTVDCVRCCVKRIYPSMPVTQWWLLSLPLTSILHTTGSSQGQVLNCIPTKLASVSPGSTQDTPSSNTLLTNGNPAPSLHLHPDPALFPKWKHMQMRFSQDVSASWSCRTPRSSFDLV